MLLSSTKTFLILFYDADMTILLSRKGNYTLPCVLFLSLNLSFWLSACTPPGPANMVAIQPEMVVTSIRCHKEYVLVPGDTIDIVVLKHSEISRSCVVRPDGYISLPILDDVKAAGLTPMALDEKLTQLLSRRLLNPEVTVIATQIHPPSVYVVGEVKNPTAISLQLAPNAAEAISRAGGFTKISAENNVIIVRVTDDNRVAAMRVLSDAADGQVAPYLSLLPIKLQPDDVVFVPKSPIGEFTDFVNLYINQVLMGVNSTIWAYTNYRLITELN